MAPQAAAAVETGFDPMVGAHEQRITHLEVVQAVQGETLAGLRAGVDGIKTTLTSMDAKLDIAAGVSTDVAILKSKDETKKAHGLNLNLAIWSAAAIAGFDLLLKLLEHAKIFH